MLEKAAMEPVETPVSEDRGIRFHTGWFSGEAEGTGRVDVSTAVGSALVMVSVKMEDGRSGDYVLDVEEAVRRLVAREFPEMEPAMGPED